VKVVAALKNQHYVPRCLFKPFSLNREGKAINLLNLGSGKAIQNASVSGQCSGDYLYGTDHTVEKGLSGIEGMYGSSLSRIIAGAEKSGDLYVLRFFSYLQARRTQIAAERMRHAWVEMQDGVFGNQQQPPVPDHKELMLDALHMCIDTHKYIQDLKVRIVENHTNIEFVLSDDPSIFTNRYALQRLKNSASGIVATGFIMLMPLTPKLAALCYDGAAYSADVVGNRIAMYKVADVETLNEFQYLKAGSNIYFGNWPNASYVHSEYERYKARRPDAWTEVAFLKSVGRSADGEHFVPTTAEDMRKGRRAMVHLSHRYPEPSRWPSVLKLRSNIKTFENGTAMGRVRKAEWLRDKNLNGPV
jgi:hypothetical protein